MLLTVLNPLNVSNTNLSICGQAKGLTTILYNSNVYFSDSKTIYNTVCPRRFDLIYVVTSCTKCVKTSRTDSKAEYPIAMTSDLYGIHNYNYISRESLSRSKDVLFELKHVMFTPVGSSVADTDPVGIAFL